MDERRLDALIGGDDALATATDDIAAGTAAYLAQRVQQVRPSRLARAPGLEARAARESADFQRAAREIAALADGTASAEARAAAARLEPCARDRRGRARDRSHDGPALPACPAVRFAGSAGRERRGVRGRARQAARRPVDPSRRFDPAPAAAARGPATGARALGRRALARGPRRHRPSRTALAGRMTPRRGHPRRLRATALRQSASILRISGFSGSVDERAAAHTLHSSRETAIRRLGCLPAATFDRRRT